MKTALWALDTTPDEASDWTSSAVDSADTTEGALEWLFMVGDVLVPGTCSWVVGNGGVRGGLAGSLKAMGGRITLVGLRPGGFAG